MNVVIIEDEKLTARRLETLLLRCDPAIRVLAHLPSVARAVAWFGQPPEPPPELIFLDIHLEDDLGFQIIEQLQLTTPVIFTTAYDQYALRAFKANSVDYLLKPIDADELAAAVEKFKTLRQAPSPPPLPDLQALARLLHAPPTPTYKDRFMVTVGTKIRSVETTDVAYFYTEAKATFLTTHDGTRLLVDYSLEKLAQLLDPRQYFRVNRAFLVALSAIRTIHTYSASRLKLDLAPKPPDDVYVSGDRMTDFKEWLGK